MSNWVLRTLWPWRRTPEVKGPIVAVLELDGVLMKPRSRQRSIPNDNIHFEKVKTAADKAFAVKGLQALALNINCPGAALCFDPSSPLSLHSLARVACSMWYVSTLFGALSTASATGKVMPGNRS